MKSHFICVLLLFVSTYEWNGDCSPPSSFRYFGYAFPQPDASSKYTNNPGNRYDDVKTPEAHSIKEVAPTHPDNSNIDLPETGPHPDSEIESVEIVGNHKNLGVSDDSFEEYDHFFPSLKGNDDFEKYFSGLFRNIEQSLREFQNFQSYGNQFMVDPFKDQNPYFNMYPNSAYALAAAGPEGTHQVAAISPENPAHGLVASKKDELPSSAAPPTSVNPWFPSFPFTPNMNNFFYTANGVNSHKDTASSSFGFPSSWTDTFSYNQPNVDMFSDRFGAEESSRSGNPHFTSVSSFSSSSSVNVNGHNVNHKTAETVVNRDGKVTKYRVQD